MDAASAPSTPVFKISHTKKNALISLPSQPTEAYPTLTTPTTMPTSSSRRRLSAPAWRSRMCRDRRLALRPPAPAAPRALCAVQPFPPPSNSYRRHTHDDADALPALSAKF